MMRRGNRQAFGAILLSCHILLVSCGTRKLEEELQTRISESAAQTARFTTLAAQPRGYPLEWKQALKLLEERNLRLRQAEDRVVDLKREADERWKTWLPRLSMFVNLNRSLSELGDLAFSDLSASVVAPLRIPNPVSERAKAYENALSYLQAVDGLELARRQQVISLHSIFVRMETMESPSGDTGEPKSVSEALRRLETEKSRAVTLEGIQSQLVLLLDLPGHQPVPVASTRPKLDYSGRFQNLHPGRNYGRLAIRLSAYRIQAAVLRERGIEIRRWPQLNLGVSTPSLYSSRSGDFGDFADADRIFLFSGLSKLYEFTGSEARTVESARENTELVKKSLRIELDQNARQWQQLQRRYEDLLLKKRILAERTGRLRGSANPLSATASLTALREAEKALANLDLAKQRLDTEIWLWDDAKWN